MSNDQEIKAKFWKAIRSDMTVMLGLAGRNEAHSQPMTAQFDDEDEDGSRGPIWFFTSSETDLVREMGDGADATLTFASKGHDLFASVDGRLVRDDDPARIDRLWNPFAAAWFEGGRQDPKLRLIRFDAGHGQIWLNENSLFAGFKMLLGADPKKDYKDKVTEGAIG